MILVSGGTGMVGAHLLYKLLSNGEKVRAIKRSTSSLKTIETIFSYHSKDYKKLLEQIEWIECDITNANSVYNAMQGIDYVYHTAAIVSFDDRKRDSIITNNITGTKNMVNAALQTGVKKFCHVSSSSALGDVSDGDIITEESLRNPSIKHSAYSESKYLSELEVWRAINEGLNAVIVNPTIILGEGEWSTGSSRIFKTVAEGLKFYTKGTNGFVDVADVVDVMIGLMKSDISGERFIVAGHNLSFKEMFGKIAKALNVKAPNIKANNLMLAIAWRAEMALSLITRKEPRITYDSIKSSKKLLQYSNEKLFNNLDFKYREIDETVLRITKNYKDNP